MGSGRAPRVLQPGQFQRGPWDRALGEGADSSLGLGLGAPTFSEGPKSRRTLPLPRLVVKAGVKPGVNAAVVLETGGWNLLFSQHFHKPCMPASPEASLIEKKPYQPNKKPTKKQNQNQATHKTHQSNKQAKLTITVAGSCLYQPCYWPPASSCARYHRSCDCALRGPRA